MGRAANNKPWIRTLLEVPRTFGNCYRPLFSQDQYLYFKYLLSFLPLYSPDEDNQALCTFKLSCRSPFVFPLYPGLLVRVPQRQIANPCRDSLNTDIWPRQSLLRRATGQTGQRPTPSVATNDATLPLHDGEGAEVIQRNRKVCSTPAKSHAARPRHVVRAGV